ncbi:hypothetical protein ACLM5H_19740 [Fredinandcohnia humi]
MFKKFIGIFVVGSLLVGFSSIGEVEVQTLSNGTNILLDQPRNINKKNLRTLEIAYQIRKNDVYIECIIPNFIFKPSGGPKIDGEGHIQVMIDGKEIDKMSTAAFIIKGLPRGEHTLKIQVVHNDLTYYPLNKTLHVDILN